MSAIISRFRDSCRSRRKPIRAVWSGAGSYDHISGDDPCDAKGLTMCNGREVENKTAGPCYNKTISKCCPDSGQSYSFAPAVCALSQECCQGVYGNATCYTPPSAAAEWWHSRARTIPARRRAAVTACAAGTAAARRMRVFKHRNVAGRRRAQFLTVARCATGAFALF